MLGVDSLVLRSSLMSRCGAPSELILLRYWSLICFCAAEEGMKGMVCRQFIIKGRVQGVGYRAWTECRARAMGLRGWVRNCRNGSVEILVCGAADTIAMIEAECRRGPPLAHVLSVSSVAVHDCDEFDAFACRPTE